ncbi:MAG: 7-cyano-7-deazaguanine reductase [Chloroflexi bacterium]|nr:MAG: 7-cyano-7-deazaguanine reductase [Chloroflexota bacterium]
MASIEELKLQYLNINQEFENLEPVTNVDGIKKSLLLCFDNTVSELQSEVEIESDEFTAVCPWTNLPDYGNLKIIYLPGKHLIELKSLKYYLTQYRNVGIVQEYAADRILNDLVDASKPIQMTIILKYKIRGGLLTTVKSSYPQQ